MKKASVVIILILTLVLLFTGCAQSGDDSDGKIRIVATAFAPYDFAREVAGDRAEVTMLLPPAAESHTYEPTPQDIIRIQKCDVFIHIGGESDVWVNEILKTADTGKIRVIALTDCVEVKAERLLEGMESGDEDEENDEHVWTSPVNAGLIAHRLGDVFGAVDSANADAYREAADIYLEKLGELDRAFREVVEGGVRRTLVFGDRFPFLYFAEGYGLECFAAFPGCSDQTEASAATVRFLIDKVREEEIPVVFHIELSNEKLAETIAEETGAAVRLFHSCHNISREDLSRGESYLSLMTRNVEVLREALSQAR